MSAYSKFLLIMLSLLPVIGSAQPTAEAISLQWKQLARIPDPDGLAGAYAGVGNGALIVAGGTNFPGNERPWTNGTKTWYDKILVLAKPGGSWKEAGRLPRPLGYGVALTCKQGLLCLGGGDAKQNYAPAGLPRLFLFGGDDGSNAARTAVLKDAHPGFRTEILCYNSRDDSWTVAGSIPVEKKQDAITNPHGSVYAPVTTPLVVWKGNIVLAGGEARPAVRSNRVLVARPVKKNKKRSVP